MIEVSLRSITQSVAFFLPFTRFGFIMSNLISILILIIIADVVISWLIFFGKRVPIYNPVIKFIRQTSGMMCNPIRRMMPRNTGMDFSTLIVVLVLSFLQQFFAGMRF